MTGNIKYFKLLYIYTKLYISNKVINGVIKLSVSRVIFKNLKNLKDAFVS